MSVQVYRMGSKPYRRSNGRRQPTPTLSPRGDSPVRPESDCQAINHSAASLALRGEREGRRSATTAAGSDDRDDVRPAAEEARDDGNRGDRKGQPRMTPRSLPAGKDRD